MRIGQITVFVQVRDPDGKLGWLGITTAHIFSLLGGRVQLCVCLKRGSEHPEGKQGIRGPGEAAMQLSLHHGSYPSHAHG